MARQNQQYGITNGPSKFDLMVSLMDGGMDNRRTVAFHYESRQDVPFRIKSSMNVRIESLEREDGSGECWIFEGYQVHDSGLRRVKGYYALRGRTGHISFAD